ncbi:MAG: hypothetical protein AB8I08_38590 [Sandaracinaceae bacterium]
MTNLSRAFRLRSTRVALVVAALAGLGLCLSPVAGVPGIESALVLGLLLPPFVAAMGARLASQRLRDEDGSPALPLLGDAVLIALTIVGLPSALLLLNLLRVPACAPLEGLAFLALGPGISVVLAAIVGVLLGVAVPRPRLATTAAVLTPIVLALLGVLRFWSTPAVYAYSHMVGYFPGTLYDPDITVTGTYISFRVLTLLWIGGAVALFGAVWDGNRLRLARSTGRLLGLAAFALLIGTLGEVYGTDLGHRSTAESIAEALGGRVESSRCVAIVPREMARADAERLAEDCSIRVRQAEAILGVRQRVPVTAFFFRSADEKRRQMGASNTYVAKPWRNEVYLQVSEWPHPVLFHEVVHVVVGNAGSGPFRVSGSLGGLIPSPAIIEGVAVAVAWGARDGLTPHQWAAAMLEADLAPALRDVDGLRFLLQPASRAYTTSGSFVRWVLETRGNAVVRALYRSGDFEESLGVPLEEAERDWHRFLREEVELPPEARALAQLRFERPGIFGQICPHRIANLRAELGADLLAGDDRAALSTCRSILELDQGQAGTRVTMVGALARQGESDEAERELSRLLGPPSAATPFIHRARLEFADARWASGASDEADAIYAALMQEPLGEDFSRQLEVRRLGIQMGGRGEAALRGLLVPRRDANRDAAIAMTHIDALSEAREDGLADYLAARQLGFRQRFDLALPRLQRAQSRGLPSERLIREAARLEAVARFGTGDLDGATTGFRTLLRRPDTGAGDRVALLDWLQRIRLSRR